MNYLKKKERDFYWSIMEDVTNTAIEMLELGLVVGSAGNVSAKIPDKDEAFITPSQIDYEQLQPYQIVHIDFEGKQLGGDWTPSSEKIMHTAIYKARPDVKAVIHTHSRFASVLSIIGKEIPPLMEEMINAIGGPIKLAKYGQVGSKEIGDFAVEALEDRKAVLLRNHGCLVCGKDLREALKIAQIVEENAEIYYRALLLGESNINHIPDNVIKFQRAIYEAFNRVPRKKKVKSTGEKME